MSRRFGDRRGLRTFAAVIAIGALMLVTSEGLVAAPATPSTVPSALALFRSHIDHIVFLMQENHAFDNLYGVYCPGISKYCPAAANGVPSTCVPYDPANLSAGCVVPYNLTSAQLSVHDMLHTWNSTHQAWDNGAMDQFYAAEARGTEPFGHYNGSTAGLYWDLAEQYGLADNFFSSDASYSLSNHWSEVASAAPNASQYAYIGSGGKALNAQYLNQSNHTLSMESTLLNSSVSWASYDFALPSNYINAIGIVPGQPPAALDYWNPLAARAQSYLPGVRSHFLYRSSFFSDAKNGSLPNVSWISPAPSDSDHPPNSLYNGQAWVASVVDAVEASPEWNSTVLFVSWDEYGGFYDHVAPPIRDAVGDGFRVPLLAIGPWVRQGAISHVSMDFNSIQRLMEERFNLTCTGPRDCHARMPLGLFNFQRTAPRAPIGFPTNGSWSYPMPKQSSGKLPPFGPFVPFQAVGADRGASVPDVVVLDWS